MICSKCGKKYDDNLDSCPYCGEITVVEAQVISEEIESIKPIKKKLNGKDYSIIIYSIFCLVLWILPYVGILIGAFGIICSISRLKDNGNKIIAYCGLIASILCTVISIIITFINIFK